MGEQVFVRRFPAAGKAPYVVEYHEHPLSPEGVEESVPYGLEPGRVGIGAGRKTENQVLENRLGAIIFETEKIFI